MHDLSRRTMLAIMEMVEWWWWGGQLSLVEWWLWDGELILVESVGCEIWDVLEVCVICSWIPGISGEQPTKTTL